MNSSTANLNKVFALDRAAFEHFSSTSIPDRAKIDADHVILSIQRLIARTLDEIVWAKNNNDEYSKYFDTLRSVFGLETSTLEVLPFIVPLYTLFDVRAAYSAHLSFGQSKDELENCLYSIQHYILTAIRAIDQSKTFEDGAMAFTAVWKIAGFEGDYTPSSHSRPVIKIPKHSNTIKTKQPVQKQLTLSL